MSVYIIPSVSDLSLQFGVPAYIVTLRHQCAHRALPSLEALKCGASTALQWLLDNYWEPQRQHNQQREENSGKVVSEVILFVCKVYILLVYWGVKSARSTCSILESTIKCIFDINL